MSGEEHDYLSGEWEFMIQSLEATLMMDHERMAMDVQLEMQRSQFEIDNSVSVNCSDIESCEIPLLGGTQWGW